MKNRKTLWMFLFIVMSGLALFFFTRHDAFVYRQPVGRIETVTTTHREATTDSYHNHDEEIRQQVTLRIINGRYQGDLVTIRHTYSQSGGLDQSLRPHQQVFLNVTYDGKRKVWQFDNLKRDTTLAMLFWTVIVLLIVTMHLQGLRALLSVALNFALFLFFIQLDVQLNLNHFFWLFALSAFLFTLLSVLLVIGWNKQSLVVCTAIFLGVTIALALGYAILQATGNRGIHYEALDFATQAPEQLFFAATVIGLLGAVMDAATDIVATLFELKRAEPKITKRQLFQSGQQVGKAIMGPLINVLLLIFFAGEITMAVVYLRTGNSIAYTSEWTMALGLAQALISAIGIVLVIPTASFLATLVLGREKA